MYKWTWTIWSDFQDLKGRLDTGNYNISGLPGTKMLLQMFFYLLAGKLYLKYFKKFINQYLDGTFLYLIEVYELIAFTVYERLLFVIIYTCHKCLVSVSPGMDMLQMLWSLFDEVVLLLLLLLWAKFPHCFLLKASEFAIW